MIYLSGDECVLVCVCVRYARAHVHIDFRPYRSSPISAVSSTNSRQSVCSRRHISQHHPNYTAHPSIDGMCARVRPESDPIK